MISITTYEAGDSLIINEKRDSRFYDSTARVNRSKTLDGGVAIDHQGYVAGDRTLKITCSLSQDDESILKSMHENETIVYVSTPNGFFTAALERVTGDNGEFEISILLKAAA